jgi:hypothetical protein
MRIPRVFLRLAFLLALVAPLHRSASETIEVSRNVNLRKAPSTESVVLRLLEPPEFLLVLEPSDGYASPYDVTAQIRPIDWIEQVAGFDLLPELTAVEEERLERRAGGSVQRTVSPGRATAFEPSGPVTEAKSYGSPSMCAELLRRTTRRPADTRPVAGRPQPSVGEFA